MDDGKRATNILTSCVITLSTEAYQSMTKEEREQYFRDGLDYFKECYPDYKILDATIHRDEGYYNQDGKWEKGLDHLQICAIPTYYNKEKDQWEISTTKAEKDHLKREMERDGRDTSHMDLREQRQYLHDRFVDYNRERDRDFDYKSREGHQSRLDVKLYKKMQDREKALDREKDKLRQAQDKTRDVIYTLRDKEQELNQREQDVNKAENRQNQFREYFNYKEDYVRDLGTTPYEYEKALRNYERTGDPTFSYFDNRENEYCKAFLTPEILNPARQLEERKELNKEYKNFNQEKEVHLIRDRERLETRDEPKQEHEQEHTHNRDRDIER